MGERINLFYIEDRKDDSDYLVEEIDRKFPNRVSVTLVTRERQFLEWVDSVGAVPDMVISDGSFPFDYPRRDMMSPDDDTIREGSNLAGLRCLARLSEDPRFRKSELVLFSGSAIGDIQEWASVFPKYEKIGSLFVPPHTAGNISYMRKGYDEERLLRLVGKVLQSG